MKIYTEPGCDMNPYLFLCANDQMKNPNIATSFAYRIGTNRNFDKIPKALNRGIGGENNPLHNF